MKKLIPLLAFCASAQQVPAPISNVKKADPPCVHTAKMLPSGETLVYMNGVLQKAGEDYSVTGSIPTITFTTPVDPTDTLSLTMLRSFVLITTVQGQPWTGVGYRLYREDWTCPSAPQAPLKKRTKK